MEQTENMSPNDVQCGMISPSPAVHKTGGKAVTHLVSMLFFSGFLLGALTLLHVMLRDSWHKITAALVGELPARRASHPWMARRVRPAVRPRPSSTAWTPVQPRCAAF